MILELGLNSNRVSRTATLKVIVIDIANIKAELKSRFNFYVNGFLHQFFKTIDFLAVLFHFGFYEGL